METKNFNGTNLLQWEELNLSPVWQIPFHLLGIGPNPLPLKLFDSGHTPNQSINSEIKLLPLLI